MPLSMSNFRALSDRALVLVPGSAFIYLFRFYAAFLPMRQQEILLLNIKTNKLAEHIHKGTLFVNFEHFYHPRFLKISF